MFHFDLSQDIERFLLKNTETKEYEIIQYLQSIGRLPKDCLKNAIGLFRSHFLIHNALYRLQLQGGSTGTYHLNISATKIELHPHNLSVETGLEHFTALSEFYLDWAHLHQTEESDVGKLLENFWQYYFNPDQKRQALAALELCDPVDFITIKKQYRRLAMIHHPDRGGDAEKLIEVHRAMKCLEQYY